MMSDANLLILKPGNRMSVSGRLESDHPGSLSKIGNNDSGKSSLKPAKSAGHGIFESDDAVVSATQAQKYW